MNKFFTLAAAFSIVIGLKAQQNVDSIQIQPKTISYNKPLPFTRIDVIDSRCDTTKSGYFPKGKSFRKLTVAPYFSLGIQNVLNNSLKSNFDPLKNLSLVIVIKNFWLTDAFIKKQTAFGSQCIVKLELYVKKDNTYSPLFRIDSTYENDESLKTIQDALVMLPFEKMLTQLEKINFDKLVDAKKLTWSDIEQFNATRFQKPLYSAVLQRGIYLTFQDFLDNRIDKRPFTIEFGKLTDELYLVDKENKTVFRDFWAVCDGDKIYINTRFNLYELKRIGKGFEFWGNAEVIGHTYKPGFWTQDASAESLASGLGNYGVQKLLSPKPNQLKPFQVNMENGTFY